MSTPNQAVPVHPERQRRVKQALTFFSMSAWVTGVWLLFLVGRMVAEYGMGVAVPEWMHYIGQVHGLFYMVYLLATLNLGTKALWPPLRWVVTALAGCIPFLSFFVEKWRRDEVKEKFQL
ncbi:DUF3817 domain-containing protein [Corynebacterium felinum]|uniref:Integral membrane protein n=1 Tax=Corynebacterium felinum TaxID=131318 RepID=A0ABU2B4X3_9CORY|nr:DUF3817 domain-containing protein [Corynebacterium felinum]MDF5820568.1 DUF3817 domain-containing protein [Corynebacterium felinum]MDR7353663.1 integral membrane protein [Corynebacterium felinum]WJY95842.1 hypothetical protein CFELI_11255 [Corynebacterium felinum]